MKAVAVFPGRQSVELVEHPEPAIEAPTQVKLRILEVGVCGTDKEICTFQYGAPPEGSEYLVIGHESLGQVIEVGPGVGRVKVGDLVVTTVRRPCGRPECRACALGRQDFCQTGEFTERGIKGRHGYMTELVVDDESYMDVVPPELRQVGVLVEPLTIAEKGLAELWQIQQRLPWVDPAAPPDARGRGHNALVLGAGPVGLLGAMAMARSGFTTFVYSRATGSAARAALVASFGATYIPAETVGVEQLVPRIGSIDVVYEAVGASDLAFQVLPLLGTNGVFIFTGVPGRKAPISVDTDLIMRDLVLKNQVVYGTVNASQPIFEAAVADLRTFMERWPDAVRALITGRYPIERFHDLLLGTPGGIKNLIQLGGATS